MVCVCRSNRRHRQWRTTRGTSARCRSTTTPHCSGCTPTPTSATPCRRPTRVSARCASCSRARRRAAAARAPSTPPSAPRTPCSRSCRPRSTCDTSRSRNYTAPPPATVHVTVHVTVHIHSTERAAHAVLAQLPPALDLRHIALT
ncbi:uncharacterized protein LOC119191504 [Manduca sexta]|uniref:uncharacterized protein LOC119191504 n=1 Tax=Manduca sexta TaxID=7130 RepID=UPI00188DE671|nr:uncharacterized protein LOC119191504 [Manduca sexta]